MNSTLLHKYAQLDAPSNEMLQRAMTHLNLSARAYERILKVGRTITDLAGEEEYPAPPRRPVLICRLNGETNKQVIGRKRDGFQPHDNGALINRFGR